MWESLKIVGLSVIATIAYGIAHNNVTARVCVEYFTVFHPVVVPTVSPTLLALTWGGIATWWMGLGLGIPLVAFARSGRPPRLTAPELIRPIGCVLLIMGISSLLMGVVGYLLAKAGVVYPLEPWKTRIPAERHTVFLADLWAHNAAYAVGSIGSVSLWGWCLRTRNSRRKMAMNREDMPND